MVKVSPSQFIILLRDNVVFGLTGYILMKISMINDNFYQKFQNQNGNDIKAVKRFQVILKKEVTVRNIKNWP